MNIYDFSEVRAYSMVFTRLKRNNLQDIKVVKFNSSLDLVKLIDFFKALEFPTWVQVSNIYNPTLRVEVATHKQHLNKLIVAIMANIEFLK